MKPIIKKIKKLARLAFVLPAVFISSCSDDDGLSGDAQFLFEEDFNSVYVTDQGDVQKYVIRSNRDWKFVPAEQENADWITIFPDEGSGDGIIKITVGETPVFTERTGTFEILLNGQPHTMRLSITQEAATPRFSFKNVHAGRVEASKLGETLSIEMDTNLEWTCTVESGSEDWISQNTGKSGAAVLALDVEPIPDDTRRRSAVVTVSTPTHPEFTSSFEVFQENIPPLEGLPLSWRFSDWVSTDEHALSWLATQTVYSETDQAAAMQWVKGPNSGVDGGLTTYDVSGGNPRVTQGREGDSWLFTFPIKNGRENQGIKMSGALRSSGAGVAWYYLQYSTDGENWNTVDPSVTTIREGVEVPHTAGIRCEDGSANWPFEKTFVMEQEVEEGFYYIRLLVSSDITQNGTLSPSATGTARIVGKFSFEKM